MSIFMYGLLLLASIAQAAQDENCSKAITRELNALGMGSFGKPADCVKMGSAENSIEFIRGKGDSRQAVVYNSRGYRSITVWNPSVVFGRPEKKILALNGNCEIIDIEVSTGGTSVVVNPRTCQEIEKAHKTAKSSDDFDAKVRKAGGGGWNWFQHLTFVNAYERLCDQYKDSFAKETSPANVDSSGSEAEGTATNSR